MTRGQYVPLSVGYGEDDRVLEAGPVAELLYLRTLALAGRRWETDGLVTVRQLERLTVDLVDLPGGPDALATLVGVGLLRPELDGTPPGYRVRSWLEWNRPAAEVLADRERKREQDRERSARYRAKSKSAEKSHADVTRDASVSHDVTNAESRRTAAAAQAPTAPAAAAAEPAAAAASSQPVDNLKRALEDAGLVARWKLCAADLEDVERLVELHGVAPLVASARRQHRPDAPAAYASAWLGGWRELSPPRPRIVRDPCPTHPYLPPAASCSACAADRKAASS